MLIDKKRSTSKTVKATRLPKAKKGSVLGGSIVKMRLKAYYPDRLDHSVEQIVDAVKRTGAFVKGPILLPKRRRQWTVLTSPHVDKDARDQFQLIQHGRVLFVYVSSADTMNAIKQLDLPSEVDVKIEVIG